MNKNTSGICSPNLSQKNTVRPIINKWPNGLWVAKTPQITKSNNAYNKHYFNTPLKPNPVPARVRTLAVQRTRPEGVKQIAY